MIYMWLVGFLANESHPEWLVDEDLIELYQEGFFDSYYLWMSI